MIKKIFLASYNAGKIKELKEMLSPLDIQVLTPHDIPVPDVEETGKTFKENALLKAISAYEKTEIPCLADDSGLCVDALDGAPGLHTARYGGYEKLLKALNNTPLEKRSAHFHTTLALVGVSCEPLYFEANCHGKITQEPIGNSGFGYDPVFIPKGDMRTYAQMNSTEKAHTSCRGKALQKVKTYLLTKK